MVQKPELFEWCKALNCIAISARYSMAIEKNERSMPLRNSVIPALLQFQGRGRSCCLLERNETLPGLEPTKLWESLLLGGTLTLPLWRALAPQPAMAWSRAAAGTVRWRHSCRGVCVLALSLLIVADVGTTMAHVRTSSSRMPLFLTAVCLKRVGMLWRCCVRDCVRIRR